MVVVTVLGEVGFCCWGGRDAEEGGAWGVAR